MTDREAVWRAIQAWADSAGELDIELRASEVDAALDAMVRAVREECAKVADDYGNEVGYLGYDGWEEQDQAAQRIAAAIRACPPPT